MNSQNSYVQFNELLNYSFVQLVQISFLFFSPAKELLKSTEFLPFPDGKFSMEENQHNGPSWQSSVTSLITAQIGLFTSDDKTTFDIFPKIIFAICKYVTSQIINTNRTAELRRVHLFYVCLIQLIDSRRDLSLRPSFSIQIILVSFKNNLR